MIMHVDDRFTGHVDDDDPRNLLTGAEGCRFPTMPPMKFRFKSSDAFGHFEVLNNEGILLTQWGTYNFRPNLFYLGGYAGPPAISIVLKKTWEPAVWMHFWKLNIGVAGYPPLEKYIPRAENSKCNVDVWVQNMELDPWTAGWTGSQAKLYQVEWDEEQPPP